MLVLWRFIGVVYSPNLNYLFKQSQVGHKLPLLQSTGAVHLPNLT